MDTLDRAQALLSAYGQFAGVAGLRFSEHGCARLLFEDSVAVDLEVDHAADCLQVYSVLGPVPPGNCESLFRSLLEGNLFTTQTGGATLSIDDVRNEVLLSRQVDLGVCMAEDLAKLLESFAGVAGHWRQKLGSGELDAPTDAGGAPQHAWGDSFLRG